MKARIVSIRKAGDRTLLLRVKMDDQTECMWTLHPGRMLDLMQLAPLLSVQFDYIGTYPSRLILDGVTIIQDTALSYYFDERIRIHLALCSA